MIANPLRADPRLNRVPDPCTIAIFGATGDLAGRKLVPALFNLHQRGLMAENFTILGIGRQEMTDEAYRELIRLKTIEHSRTEVTAEAWDRFSGRISYVGGDLSDRAFYAALAPRLPVGHSALFYLAVPPSLFTPIVDGLADSGLSKHAREHWRRVVIEKPFGHDLASSVALDNEVHHGFRESQVFRIDHYLGKETVQNILVFRFANGIFEPVWNRNFIDHVQITVAESIGVEGRGRFYEEAGAFRDIIQNHVLQVLSFIAMEPPPSFAAESVRDERAKALAAMKELELSDVVRGQYADGFTDGKPVPGYRAETGVSPESMVETYVAARLSIENWRWAGVPFYVRTGKRLTRRATEVAIQFKRVPHLPFDYAASEQLESNELVLRVQPNEGVTLRLGAKVPASRLQIRTVNMSFDYDTAFAAPPAEAYETLLIDAVRGDATNFPRQDAVVRAWEIVQPVLDGWAQSGGGPHVYAAGSSGPGAADELLVRDGRRWRQL